MTNLLRCSNLLISKAVLPITTFALICAIISEDTILTPSTFTLVLVHRFILIYRKKRAIFFNQKSVDIFDDDSASIKQTMVSMNSENYRHFNAAVVVYLVNN